MKKQKSGWIARALGLSGAIGLALILSGCGAAPTPTPDRPSTLIVPAASPETPPSATLTATAAATAAATAIPTNTTPPTEAPAPTAAASTAPDCTSPAALTPAQTEGPYYTPNSPERVSLIEPGMSGTKLILSGYVLTTACQPIAHAWLDFWQADAEGAYDNAGYRLRGHLFTDEQGRYTLETIVPGEYPGRTEHIHVKVQPPNSPILTTQIYFPGVAANNRDSIFDPALLADVQDTANGKMATFNFVVRP